MPKDHLSRRLDVFNMPSVADVLTGAAAAGTPLTKRTPRDDFQVVVTKRTRRGRTKLHTFVMYRQRMGQWAIATPLTLAEQDAGIDPARSARTRHLGIDVTNHGMQLLPEDAVLHLDDGCDVPTDILRVILDACKDGERWSIDIADMNTVVSQLSPAIRKLGELAPEQARLAVAALYTEILRRCTSI